jgi:hypothetical protein
LLKATPRGGHDSYEPTCRTNRSLTLSESYRLQDAKTRTRARNAVGAIATTKASPIDRRKASIRQLDLLDTDGVRHQIKMLS